MAAVHRQRRPRQPAPPLSHRPASLAAAIAVLALILGCVSACGGSHAGHGRKAPDLAAFLRLPVATPTQCGSAAGATAGRRSPWVGTVDVSVFLTGAASAGQVAALGQQLRSAPEVATVYFESADDAYAEFQRLYTCSADVPRSALHASYRLVLRPITRPARDAFVARLRRLTGVEAVSCDPSSPCLG